LEAGRPPAVRSATVQIKDVMTRDPACCGPGTNIQEVAALMVERDCGEIPVCDDARRALGVVTDRDIVCRLVAKGVNPVERTARDAMSEPVVTCTPDTDVAEAAQLMERHHVRRLPVVDREGTVCGVVAQADLARKSDRETAIEVVEKVSEPTPGPSTVGRR
jgi:CBS domain-containing protein